MKDCFYCGFPIEKGNGRIVPLEIPYVNLWAHKEICSTAITKEWLQENIKRVLDYMQDLQTVHKKRV